MCNVFWKTHTRKKTIRLMCRYVQSGWLCFPITMGGWLTMFPITMGGWLTMFPITMGGFLRYTIPPYTWNEPDFRERIPDSLHLGGSPRRATTCNTLSQQYQKSIQRENKWSTTFIYYINQSTSLRHMSGTSLGLNQTEVKLLAAAPYRRGKLHIRRHLERRKSTSHPIRRCRSRSLALCQRH
jgi:hypothetical protein